MKIQNVSFNTSARKFYIVFQSEGVNYSLTASLSQNALQFKQNRIRRNINKLIQKGWEIEHFAAFEIGGYCHKEYISFLQQMMTYNTILDKEIYIENLKNRDEEILLVSYEPSYPEGDIIYRWIGMRSKPFVEEYLSREPYQIHEF